MFSSDTYIWLTLSHWTDFLILIESNTKQQNLSSFGNLPISNKTSCKIPVSAFIFDTQFLIALGLGKAIEVLLIKISF